MEHKSVLVENERAFLAFGGEGDDTNDFDMHEIDGECSPSFSTDSPSDSQGFQSTYWSNNYRGVLSNGASGAEAKSTAATQNSMNEFLPRPPLALNLLKVSAEDVIFAMDAYIKVGISNDLTELDDDLIAKVEQGLGQLRLQAHDEALVTSWLHLIQSGARMQHGILAEAEVFVADYSSYLSNIDLSFGCMPSAIPSWATAQSLNPQGPTSSTQSRSAKSESSKAKQDSDWSEDKQFKKRRQNLKAIQQEVLFTWLEKNMDQPYPGKTEKDELAAKTGMSKVQIDNWFINARRRYVPQMKAARAAGKGGIAKSFIAEDD